MRYWYVATPYRGHPAGLDAGFEAACRFTGRLLDKGLFVYSPIAHCHPLASHSVRDHREDFWVDFQKPFLDAAAGIIVAKIPGWDLSRGIAFERAYMEGQRKPSFLIDEDFADLPGSLR